MLHWGSQGIARNLREAAEYYRMGAEGADGNDPVATYDYGVVLLRVGTSFLFRIVVNFNVVSGPFSGPFLTLILTTGVFTLPTPRQIQKPRQTQVMVN